MAINKSKGEKPSLTMYEIARQAGVSQSTVSRVLNGHPTVKPEIRDAVMAVIQQLNYRPNLAAQGLVSGKTTTIGVLSRHLGSPYYGEIITGISKGMEGSNYYPIIGLGGELPNEDLRALNLLLARGIDGLIVSGTRQISDDELKEIAMQMPLIIIGRCVDGLEGQCAMVNNAEGAYMATSYLIQKGHTSIVHITGLMSLPDAVARYEGYCKALTDHGIAVNPDLVIEGDFTEVAGTLAIAKVQKLRQQYPVTAIFAANDQTATGARLGMYHAHLSVPDDISLIGFDDLFGAQYTAPPLTTIRQPVYQMGVTAANAILAMLAGQPFTMPDFPLELVERLSVAIR